MPALMVVTMQTMIESKIKQSPLQPSHGEEPQVKATLKPTQVTEVIPESMNANPSPVPTLVAPKPKPWTTDRTWEGAVVKIVGLTPVYKSSQANHPNCAQLCKHLREKNLYSTTNNGLTNAGL